jgi:hypothetical protein
MRGPCNDFLSGNSIHVPRRPSPMLVIVISLFALGQTNSTALAGCEALGICSKTIHLRAKTITKSDKGDSVGTFSSKVYIAKNGNAYLIGESNEHVTNKVGGSFVGTVCSENGQENVSTCPGTATCTNRYRGDNLNSYSSKNVTRCTVIYNSDGFVIRSEYQIYSKQHITTPYGDPSGGDQTSIQEGSSEGRYYVRGDNCSYTGRATGENTANNTWGSPFHNRHRSSFESLSCRITDGRDL